jgi:hypothetical protein
MLGAGMNQGIQTTLGSDNWREYQISQHINWLSNGAIAMVAEREYYQILDNPVSGVLTGLRVDVTTAQASSGLKVAIFSLNSSNLPGEIVCSFSAIDTTSTGVKTVTTGFTPARITRGPVYAIGFITNAAIALRGSTAAAKVAGHRGPWGRQDAYGQIDGIYKSGSYTTGLAANPSFSGATAQRDAMWYFGLRVEK